MILSCSNISKAFGTEEILKHVSFHVEDHEKAAIVGINGAGKSTLLKIIVGELAADEGSVTITKGKTLGYLALELQMKHAEGEKLETMLNTYSRLNHEFELLNGYAWQSEITGVLKGLGFVEEEFSKPVSELSGGQKTRVSLGKLLLSKPDIILLDEPTNHLVAGNLSDELRRDGHHRRPRPLFSGPRRDQDRRAGRRHRHLFPGQLHRLQREKSDHPRRCAQGLLKPTAGDPPSGGGYHQTQIL